jgi:pantoate--beta-alanine ligase
MEVIRTVRAMQRRADTERSAGRRIGFVPTMGALHEGHLDLVRLARSRADCVVVSIFVNPTQFGPGEDFARYPRDFTRDEQLLAAVGADLIFYPDTAEMYPAGHATRVNVEGLTDDLCGRTRPGHFEGVTTIVTKLFNVTRPHFAVFGQKDAQQVFVVRRMTQDLDFDIEIVMAPTRREPDGLALSSRNQYLSPDERAQAPALYRALRHGEDLVRRGERSASAVIAAVRAIIEQATRGRIDYVSIVDTETLRPMARLQGECLIALAVFLGRTRLIDNTIVRV